MTPASNERLPLWRLIAALLVVAAMVTVLVALAPVYIEDYQLGQHMKSLARGSLAGDENAQDNALRAAVLTRARELDLPVRTADLQITHPEGKMEVQMKYVVQMDFPLYQVDVHFHHSARQ